MKLEHSLTLYMKVNPNGKDLNVRGYAIKLLEENIGRTLWHKSQYFFFDLSPKEKENKWYDMCVCVCIYIYIYI